jgi:hypothetical protein
MWKANRVSIESSWGDYRQDILSHIITQPATQTTQHATFSRMTPTSIGRAILKRYLSPPPRQNDLEKFEEDIGHVTAFWLSLALLSSSGENQECKQYMAKTIYHAATPLVVVQCFCRAEKLIAESSGDSSVPASILSAVIFLAGVR